MWVFDLNLFGGCMQIRSGKIPENLSVMAFLRKNVAKNKLGTKIVCLFVTC